MQVVTKKRVIGDRQRQVTEIVIENGLVPIYQDAQEQRIVNARELHEFLGVGKDFSTWIKGRLDKYSFVEGEDYSVQEVLSSPDLGSAKARPQIRVDYLLTIDTAKEIAMAENSEKGREVRRYFIACEKKLREIHLSGAFADQLPKTFPQALRALAEAEEQRMALAAKVEADAGKVLFAEAVQTSRTSILVGDLAKILRQNGVLVGQKRLFEWLREEGFLIRQRGESWNMPTQRAMEQGLFEVRERTINNPDGSIRITRTPKVTGKGQQYFVQRFLAPAGAAPIPAPGIAACRS